MIEPTVKSADAAVPSVKKEEGWWETVKVIIEALLIALVLRTLLFQPFNIPSGSLVPTLLVGDYLFVSKYAYGYSHFSLPGFFDPTPEAVPGSRDLNLGILRVPSVATIARTLNIPQPELAGRMFAS